MVVLPTLIYLFLFIYFTLATYRMNTTERK